jgi:PKD domain
MLPRVVRMWKRVALLLIIAVCLAMVVLGASAPGDSSSPDAGLHLASQPHNKPAASTDTISSNGNDPQAISLYWTTTGDYLFESYTLQESTTGSNGPWSEIAVITTSSDTTYVVTGLTPGGTYWWSILDTDDFGSQMGNAYQATQPNSPTLSYTQPTETSATLTWSNPASYGGGIAFGSYAVMESINGGSFTSADTITTVSDTGYSATELSLSTPYKFYVTTTDAGFGTPYIGSQTNTASFTTTAPLTSTSVASPATINAGQSTTLACTANGGAGPYSYSWVFGDGKTATGSPVVHSYGSSGSFTATCTVTDSNGVVATSSAIVTVNPTVAGLPAGQGYAVIGGSIAVVVVIVIVVAVLLLRRGKSNRPPPRRYSQAPPPNQPPNPPAT